MAARRPKGAPARVGHNGGPPLEPPPHVPEWGRGGFKTYFGWKKARQKAWSVPPETKLRRAEKAECLGLTYEEYALEILERGRHLQEADAERVAAIKRGRR